jgi:hypothetical protein
VFAALKSPDRHERARAIEFLDALVRSWEQVSDQTPGVLRLVVDDLSPEERARAAAPLVGTVSDASEALSRLAEDSDPMLRELAHQALGPAHHSRPRSEPPARSNVPQRGLL